MVHLIALIAALTNLAEFLKGSRLNGRNTLLLLTIFVTLVYSIKYLGVDDVIRLIEALYVLFESSNGSNNAIEIH